MNATVVFLMAALTAAPESEAVTQQTFFSAETYFEASIRGQEPGLGAYEDDPLRSEPPATTFAPGAVPPGAGAPVYGPGAAPYGYDPFLGPPPGDAMGAYDPSLSFGPVGPQPYRFGWSKRFDIGYLPSEGVTGGGANGNFSVFEFNTAWRYTTGWPAGFPNTIFSWTPEFNHRSWSGPSNPGLPANVFRFASDFELSSPANNPLSYQVGFTPAFVSDLNESPNGDAFNWDARGVVFFRTSQQLMIALGAAYLDRVDNIIIPYAGVVWTPNDRWELRLLFPKSRISYFVGNLWGSAAWLYGGVEYNVEAYQIELVGPSGAHEKIQISDYRALFGLRTEGSGVNGFVEAGWVFARDVQFLHGTPSFDINTGFIARMGLRF